MYAQSKLVNRHTRLTDSPKLYQGNYFDASAQDKQSTDTPIKASRADAKVVLFEGKSKKRLKSARYTTCEVGVDDWYIKADEIELDQFTESGSAKHAYVEFKGLPLLYSPYMSFSFNNERKSGFWRQLLAQLVEVVLRHWFLIILILHPIKMRRWAYVFSVDVARSCKAPFVIWAKTTLVQIVLNI